MTDSEEQLTGVKVATDCVNRLLGQHLMMVQSDILVWLIRVHKSMLC